MGSFEDTIRRSKTLNRADQASVLLASIVESSDDAIISKTLDGLITSWNTGAEQLFGYSADEAIGKPITLIIPEDRLDEEPKIIESLRRGQRVDHYETKRRRKDGALIDISVTISPLKDSTGVVIGASKVARDISRRKRTERTLAEQARLLDLSKDAIIVRAPNNRITYWNKGASEIYGFSRDEAVNHISHELLRSTFPEPYEQIMEALLRDDFWNGELIHTTKGGDQIVVTSRWVLDRDPLGNPQSILETNTDITHQKQNERALRESEEQLRILAEALEVKVHNRTQELEKRSSEVFELSMRLLRTQDNERRHIARELHDTAGQTMAVVGMKLQRLLQTAKEAAPQLVSEVEAIQSLVEKLNQEIRTTSYLLHPPLLDESGLSESLAWYVVGLSERSGLNIKLSVSEDLGRLPQDMELVIFRLIQECLTNVHRHSGGNAAFIRIIRTADEIKTEVEDHGKGMTPERLTQVQSEAGGVGIRGMRERVRQFGGKMRIESDKTGTTVSVIFPLQAQTQL